MNQLTSNNHQKHHFRKAGNLVPQSYNQIPRTSKFQQHTACHMPNCISMDYIFHNGPLRSPCSEAKSHLNKLSLVKFNFKLSLLTNNFIQNESKNHDLCETFYLLPTGTTTSKLEQSSSKWPGMTIK